MCQWSPVTWHRLSCEKANYNVRLGCVGVMKKKKKKKKYIYIYIYIYIIYVSLILGVLIMHENTEWNTNTEDDNSCTLRPLPLSVWNSELQLNFHPLHL